MKYLLDANVFSEMAMETPRAGVLDWLRWHEHESGTSSVVIAELDYGIQLMPHGQRRKRLETWLAGLLEQTAVIPFDVEEVREYARLMAKMTQAGSTLPTKEAMIAATALVHGLAVVTRNVKDFERAGVPVLNPFQGA